MRPVRQKHFLIITYPAQGHINPAIHLANRLARTVDGVSITFSTAISGHRKMFPNLSSPDEEINDGAIAYLPFSDGYDDGFRKGIDDEKEFRVRFRTTSSKNLTAVIDKLKARGKTIDCIIYTFFMSCAADVARAHGIRSAQYWIQPATVFAIYYHSFHGYGELIASQCKDPSATVELPGLPPFRARELPSFVLSSSDDDSNSAIILAIFKEAFTKLDLEQKSKPKVLVNTLDELERDAFSSVSDVVELIAVGPILQNNDVKDAGFSLFKPDEKAYMEWLDSKAEGSVVYVSFGSVSVVKKQQMEEISKGLKASGRPYLWVVRRDSRYEGDGLDDNNNNNYDDNGMIVEWCTQMRVLSHPAVGCFVTHCGWNSTLESLVCGVPTVGVPQWSDQGTNAMLMEKAWGTGIRGEVNEDGVLECEELKRCLHLVFEEGVRGAEIRTSAESCKEKALRAIGGGGSSDQNLRTFVDEIKNSDK